MKRLLSFIVLSLPLYILCLSSCSKIDASIYYVSFSDGNDKNDGITPATAWKTISKVNTKTFKAGDSILFKCGDTWRNEGIEVNQSGTKAAYITYSSYGKGKKPRILGSTRAVNWELTEKTNVWKCKTLLKDPWTTITAGGTNCEIFFELLTDSIVWGYHELYTVGLTNLNAEYEWTWNNNELYIYSPTKPDARYSSIEAPQIQYGAQVNYVEYQTFNNIEFAYFAGYGIRDAYGPRTLHGQRVTNCYIHHIGRKGSNVAYGTYTYHSDGYYSFNEIHDCGRRGISVAEVRFDKFACITENIIIENNYFHDGWHTTGIDLNITGIEHVLNNVQVRNNFFEGNPNIKNNDRDYQNSNHLYISNQCPRVGTTASVRNIWVYNNIFTYSQGSAIKIEKVDSIYIWNNTFYCFNPTLSNYQAFVYVSENDMGIPVCVEVKNNIFYNNILGKFNSDLHAIKADADWYKTAMAVDYNLYYSQDPGCNFVEIRGAEDKNKKWVRGQSFTVSQWNNYKLQVGFDANSPVPNDPLFIDPSINNFNLSEKSKARGTGVKIPTITSDFNGNAMNTPPDLGAIQYNTKPLKVVKP